MSDVELQERSTMREDIRRFLMKNAATTGVGRFGDDDSLLELGVIDSVAMLDLIEHIEAAYKISVDQDEMVPENFRSIAAICNYIESKRV
jgi:acyl carrier protein